MSPKIKKWMFLAALAAVMSSAAAASAQAVDTAYVPFVVVNTDATVKVYNYSMLMLQKAVSKNVETTLAVPLSGGGSIIGSNNTGVLSGSQRQLNAPAVVSSRAGKVVLSLSPQSYKSAEVSLYTVSGKRVMRGHASAAAGAASVSRRDLTAGVYLLSVKGADGGAFTSKVSHRGGGLDVSVAFLKETQSPSKNLSKESAAQAGVEWSVTVSASGYIDSAYAFEPVKGRSNAKHTVTLKQPTATDKKDFTEKVGNVSFDMVYIPGGEFTIGCEKESGCPSDTKPVSGVKVSNYFIGKTEVSTALWHAVMGTTPPSYGASGSYTSMTWYEAIDCACKLSQITGRRYRMITEAEFEYAAKKHLDKLEKVGSGSGSNEEWAYNSWSSTHSGGTDPVGPQSGAHTQKTRRDANGYGDNITARLIRSIEGVGPTLRLAISADADYPPNYVPPCDLHIPNMSDADFVNSYRDTRWVTGDEYEWSGGFAGSIIKVWDDGAAVMGMMYNGSLWTDYGMGASGEWYTVNNFAFKIASTSARDTVRPKLAYIFVDNDHVSVISDNGMAIGRFEKRAATVTVKKPTIPGTALTVLASAPEDKMYDMANIPAAAKQQDPRLLDGGATKGWFQNNTEAGGVHHYRKDVDLDEFRFTVNQNNGRTMLANGSWFTVNNTFLRVTHSTGYVCDYLYAVADTGSKRSFYHNSFMGYERGDFRVFKIESNASWPTTTCGAICSEEIPKGLGASMYAPGGYFNENIGKSTYEPPPCPAGGCK